MWHLQCIDSHPHSSETVMKYQSLLVAAACVATASCSLMHRGSSGNAPEPAVVYFTNGSLNQADVYAISSSTGGTRIGTVMAGRTEALPIPNVAMGSGQIVVAARIIAHSGFIGSAPFAIHAGDEYSVRLQSEDSPTLVVLPAQDKDIAAAQRRPPQ
jgi:hypothetical protein